MKVGLEPGKYIVAVSGGVDSVVLLDLLSKENNLEIIVAHFDHGIRDDSHLDTEFVQNLAKKYRLKYESDKGELGTNASEEKAREARYKFLHKIVNKYDAKAIITAHHSDDMLETALINLVRGTGRKGLSSLKSTDKIIRPLLNFSKEEIITYANENDLGWREDSTNQSDQYLRNRIRKKLFSASPNDKKDLLDIIEKSHTTNIEIDKILSEFIEKDLMRKDLIVLDYSVLKEIIAEWLRLNSVAFDKKLLNQLAVKSCTARPGTLFVLKKDAKVLIDKDRLSIV